MDIDELQTVQSRERQTDSLQQLRDSFYAEASEYVQGLREARSEAADRADDPWKDPEVGRLSDEIETAEGTVRAIYERRIGKIVKKASLAAADMPADAEGLTTEEREMFDQLVATIENNREQVLQMITGNAPVDTSPVRESSRDAEGDQDSAHRKAEQAESGGETTEESAPEPPAPSELAPETVPGPTEPAADEGLSEAETPPEDVPEPGETPQESDASSVSAADVMDAGPDNTPEVADDGGDSTGETGSAGADRIERRTVRITEDVGEILGVDQREYDLEMDDVVTLPVENAEPLLERDAAQPLE